MGNHNSTMISNNTTTDTSNITTGPNNSTYKTQNWAQVPAFVPGSGTTHQSQTTAQGPSNVGVRAQSNGPPVQTAVQTRNGMTYYSQANNPQGQSGAQLRTGALTNEQSTRALVNRMAQAWTNILNGPNLNGTHVQNNASYQPLAPPIAKKWPECLPGGSFDDYVKLQQKGHDEAVDLEEKHRFDEAREDRYEMLCRLKNDDPMNWKARLDHFDTNARQQEMEFNIRRRKNRDIWLNPALYVATESSNSRIPNRGILKLHERKMEWYQGEDYPTHDLPTYEEKQMQRAFLSSPFDWFSDTFETENQLDLRKVKANFENWEIRQEAVGTDQLKQSLILVEVDTHTQKTIESRLIRRSEAEKAALDKANCQRSRLRQILEAKEAAAKEEAAKEAAAKEAATKKAAFDEANRARRLRIEEDRIEFEALMWAEIEHDWEVERIQQKKYARQLRIQKAKEDLIKKQEATEEERLLGIELEEAREREWLAILDLRKARLMLESDRAEERGRRIRQTESRVMSPPTPPESQEDAEEMRLASNDRFVKRRAASPRPPRSPSLEEEEAERLFWLKWNPTNTLQIDIEAPLTPPGLIIRDHMSVGYLDI